MYSYSDYVFLCEFWWVVSFTELVHFISVITFVSIEFFIVFFHYPFSVLEISSDDPSFLFYITNFCLLSLSFFLVWLDFLYIFKKPVFVFVDLFSLFLVLLISALVFCFLFFLLLALSVIILFDAHIVPDLASGNFLKWMPYRFDLTWLVIECFVQNEMSAFQLVLTLPQPGTLHSLGNWF